MSTKGFKFPKMRLISCRLTTSAVVERRKTATRRWGWDHAQVGMVLRVVDRQRYRKSDPPQQTLAIVEVVDVNKATKHTIGGYRYDEVASASDLVWASMNTYRDELAGGGYSYAAELAREGLPNLSIEAFVDLLLENVNTKVAPWYLTRIEWKYREDLFARWKESGR